MRGEKMPKENTLRKPKQKWQNIPLNYTSNQPRPTSAPPSNFWLPPIHPQGATETTLEVQTPPATGWCPVRSEHFLKDGESTVFQATCSSVSPPLQLKKNEVDFPVVPSLCPLPLLPQGTTGMSPALYSPHPPHQVFRHMDEILPAPNHYL